METKAYDYIQNKINDLSEINLDITDNKFYNYEEINFLCKLNKGVTNLAVIFHGASQVTGKDRIVFRGYEFILKKADILSISDSLLNIYKENQYFWFLSTEKHKFHKKYRKIIEYFINSKKYKNIVFTGTSAGGYPSIYYASYFNKIAITSNPQLYLEKYIGFRQVSRNINQFEDKIGYENRQIERNIKNAKPVKIIIYCNKKDSTYKEHVIPFVKFMKSKDLQGLLELKYFEPSDIPEDKIHHQILFPKNKKHVDILNDYFNKSN